MILTVRRC